MLFTISSSSAQHVFTVLYENSVNVINEVDESHYKIILNNNEQFVSIKSSKVRIADTSIFLPGYIEINDESYVATDYDDQQRKVGGSFYFRYNARVTSNRDFDNPYMVIKWEKPDRNSYIAAMPLSALNKDEPRQIALSLYALERFRMIEPEIYYMNMGFEVGTSKTIEKPITPYQYCVDKAGGTLADGNLAMLQMIPSPVIKDAEGDKREGQVNMLIEVDELGYVTGVEVKKATEWVFAKSALMTVPFYLFQPKIVDGKPVPSRVVAPLKF